MDQIPLGSIGTSDSSNGPEVQIGSMSSPDGTSTNQPADFSGEPSSDSVSLFSPQRPISNLRALAWRFIQLCLRPERLAPIVLDLLSLSLSILWTERQPGPDLLYPLSNLKKHKSGRLARLLLEHSRDLQLRNLHVASSPRDGVDPPRVAVINLDEVPPEIVERGYTVSADFYGLVVMVLFLQILVILLVNLISPIDTSPYYEWLDSSMASWFGDRIGAWGDFLIGIILDIIILFLNNTPLVVGLCVWAVSRGDGTLTLVRRSDSSTPGCAVLLDRDFALLLIGTQSVVESIAESSFRISHSYSSKFQVGRQFGQLFFHEVVEALCRGTPFAMLVGFWLLLLPASFLTVSVAWVLIVVMSLVCMRTGLNRLVRTNQAPKEFRFSQALIVVGSFFAIMPAITMMANHQPVTTVDDSIPRNPSKHVMWLHLLPEIFLIIHFLSSRNYHIRTTKFLDVLGHPPVRRWEFDTLAAAATFQCLVLCRGIPRPVRSIDVSTLLDTLVPDERDVWKVWKARVADRIAHEIDISFAPMIPSFGDQRQKHLKELLDQAQIGYDTYAGFYDWHVPLHSTIAL